MEPDSRVLNSSTSGLAFPLHKRPKKRCWMGVLAVFIGSLSVAVYIHRPATTHSFTDISAEQWLKAGKKVVNHAMNGVDYAVAAIDAMDATLSAMAEHKTPQLISGLPVVATKHLAGNAQDTLDTVTQFSRRVRQDVPEMPPHAHRFLNRTEAYLRTGGEDIEQASASISEAYERKHRQNVEQALDDLSDKSAVWWQEHWLAVKTFVLSKVQR
ncbi:hypothetical protein IOQ59_03540 [Pontibacterium sp. N1Y112]|uniref:Uncharacterized protein n=1 Tax=Pontibacterium sinense TaxID=2781979 RepID=A0A8J7FHS8_9GAMM|nr:hypothetical protein [Pontibacterium sinense]MBE9396328.1 hypothetical protein [Pontibacterium sinense]